MRSTHLMRREWWSGDWVLRGRSNTLLLHGLGEHRTTLAARGSSTFLQSFVFPWPNLVVAVGYKAGPSAFRRTRPH